jgi:hypothetical protein
LRLWKVLALVPILGGCDLFTAETDIDNACVQLENQTIDGAPLDKLTRSFSYDQGLSVFDGFIALDADVTKIKIDLQAVRGVSDLSFLKSVHVSIAAEDLPPLAILTCDDGACASSSLETSIEVSAPPNLTNYALGGHVVITITLEGELPPEMWVANLKVCMSGTARISAGF